MGATLPVGITARQDFLDQRGSNCITIEGNIDVAIHRLNRPEDGVAAGGDVVSNLLRQEWHALSHGAGRQGLRLLLGETLQLAAGLKLICDGLVGQAVGGRGGQTPGSLEGDRAHVDIARGKAQRDERFRNRLRRLLLATRHDPDPVTAARAVTAGCGNRGRRAGDRSLRGVVHQCPLAGVSQYRGRIGCWRDQPWIRSIHANVG